MGWSCRADAGEVLQKWTDACIASTGIQNVIKSGDGQFLIEVSNREHGDGAITGSILWSDSRFSTDQLSPIPWHRRGSFRIEGCGCITRAPAILRHQHKDCCNRCLYECDECHNERCDYESPKATRYGVGSGGGR